MENRRARKNARKPQAPKGDMSKLNKDLEKLNQMQDAGFKSTIGKGRGPMTNKKTVKLLPKKTLKTPNQTRRA